METFGDWSLGLILSFLVTYYIRGGQIITDPNSVLIKGSEASLQCSFRGTPLRLYWLKMVGLSTSEREPLIGWSNGRTLRPEYDSGKFNLSENFSLTFTADTGDAGRYLCDVSNDKGIKIEGYTYVTVSVPPVDPFPMIDNFTISDGNRPTTITCRADGASIGLADLRWMHNGDEYPQIIRNFTIADGTTENLTATIEALVSEEPYICVGTLNATKLVTSTDKVFVQRALFTTIPSEGPTETVTPSEAADNNDSTVIAVAVLVSILLLAALTAIAVYIYVKKENRLPKCPLRLYTKRQKEEHQQSGPELTLQGASQGEANVTLMTPIKQ